MYMVDLIFHILYIQFIFIFYCVGNTKKIKNFAAELIEFCFIFSEDIHFLFKKERVTLMTNTSTSHNHRESHL